VSGFLDSRRWYVLAALYFIVISLGHLEFSLWLVKQRQFGNTTYALKDFVPAIAAASAFSLVLWVAYIARRHAHPYLWAINWLVWFGCIFLVDRFLTFSLNETAHYPQYALMAWLVARCIDPLRRDWRTARVIFWTTLLGMVDETMQYLWITTSYSEHLDFNDFVVNLLAAVAGVLIYYARAEILPRYAALLRSALEFRVFAGLVVCVSVGLLSGHLLVNPDGEVPPGGIVRTADGKSRLYLQRKPGLYGSYNPGPYRGRYWILDPVKGGVLILAAGLGFTALSLALRRVSKTERGRA
jgi:hypothetical protein